MLLLQLYLVLTFFSCSRLGIPSQTSYTVDNIVDKNPELVLGLGDYEYYGDDAD
jgi:hypothetical protein